MYKPSTLIRICSKLKACLSLYDGLAIKKFTSLQKFVKRTNKGYETKKATILTKEEIQSFLINAPDTKYLLQKVILILGVVGVLRKTDLYNLEMSQITDKSSHIVVNLKESKTKRGKRFPIVFQEDHPYNPVAVIQKYLSLRKVVHGIPFLLLQIRFGKITKQRVGINTVGDACKTVAKFLKLPNFEKYTSHSMRRSGATSMAKGGVSFLDLKNYGNWASDSAAQGYVDQSMAKKIETAQKLSYGSVVQPAPSAGGGEVIGQLRAEVTSSSLGEKSLARMVEPQFTLNGNNNRIGSITINVKYD